ncbi:MAG: DNA methyltransferase [Pseudonocardiales bacterium]|nr:MAG: DNA methyltransferase [Pseudonocardiales bacterium]
MKEIGSRHGLQVVPVGEAMLSDLQVRPDYAVQVNGAICGYIEIKKPGLGADAPALTGKHNRQQWARLSNLPNLIYTDGMCWARYETSLRKGEIIKLDGTLTEGSGDLRVTGPEFEQMLVTFLGRAPSPIRNVDALVRAVAPACRLLRDEVADQLARERVSVTAGSNLIKQLFSGLAADWRQLLFPTADDGEFADGYAQTVTFGLLYARSRGIAFEERGYHEIGDLIATGNTLMGRALQVLTDQFGGSSEQVGPFKVTLDTLLRVVGAVDWERVRAGRRDTYLYLYEHFLAEYDPVKRQESGVYFTPVELVEPMVRLTDDALRTRLGLVRGLGTDGVRVVDPAAGTGTFLLRILDTVFDRVERTDGTGEAREVLSSMANRLVGFELQMGPYAVSELRLTDLLAHRGVELTAADRMPLHVTNTLDDPFRAQPPLASFLKAIADSTRRADRIKAELPVTVVIGNPPYRERANGDGSWVESGGFYGGRRRNEDASLMSDFRLPGNGRNEYKLKNMAWYFWRWATWKVFDSQSGQGHGVVTFVTTAGYLRGTAFKGMRKYLRRTCDEGWIIDLSPEGMRPDVATRIFPKVQHPLAVGIFVRAEEDTTDEPARIHYTAVHGKRAEKFATLGALGLDDPVWQDARDGWDAPFTPSGEAGWDEHPALDDLFPVRVAGVKANRAWVFSPRPEVLRQRWRRLLAEPDPVVQAELLKATRDRTMASRLAALSGGDRLCALADETDLDPPLRQVLHRSFDRKWLVADPRVVDFPRPDLWRAATYAEQLFLVELHSQVVRTGPGVVVGALLPDQHCFKGSEGGRVLPVFQPDGRPACGAKLLGMLSKRLGIEVTGLDLLCYVAAVVSHPGYTARFVEQLETPGVRVPLTADPETFTRAVGLGREVVWASTYGQRCADPAAGRPGDDISLPPDQRPMSLDGIPHTPEGMPATIEHSSDDPGAETDDVLLVGASRFQPVPAAVWRYDVGGKPVLRQWFAYRKREPGGRVTSSLDLIVADRWLHEDTVELRELLSVLRRLTDLAPPQAELLDQVCAGPLITVDELTLARVLPVPDSQRVLVSGPPVAGQGEMHYTS